MARSQTRWFSFVRRGRVPERCDPHGRRGRRGGDVLMKLGLEGKTAVVSGGSRRIGRAIAMALAGANVVIVAHTPGPLAQAQAQHR
jgi:hypothetical protein